MTKMTGAMAKRYWADLEYWQDNFIEDDRISVNGEYLQEFDPTGIQDTDIVRILEGYVRDGVSGKDLGTLASHARKWLKKQSSVQILVQVPLTKLEALKRAIRASGGTVV